MAHYQQASFVDCFSFGSRISHVARHAKYCAVSKSRSKVVQLRRQWRSLYTAAVASSPAPQEGDVSHGSRPCLLYDLHDQVVPYEQAWQWQHRQLERTLAERAQGGTGSDALFIMQHRPVYTLGTGSSKDHLLFDPSTSRIPLYRTERGGEVTYHGPGQLVMYPLLHLGAPGAQAPRDLHLYMRSLEEVVIRALDDVSGLQGERIEGLTGVWVGHHKLAAIGVRAKQWVTYHGLALNVCPDLRPFDAIVPCGISNKAVGSVAQQLGSQQLVEDCLAGGAADHPLQKEGKVLECSQMLTEYRYALLEAFEGVFGLRLVSTDEDDLHFY